MTPSPTSSRTYSTTLRFAGAFAAILVLFAAALVVVLQTLDRVAQAEAEIAQLDHAKHTGHLAVAQVRELHILRMRALMKWGGLRSSRYQRALARSEKLIRDLLRLSREEGERGRAEAIARLTRRSERDFQERVRPTLAKNDPAGVRALYRRSEELVRRVVGSNEELNRLFERRSDAARERAARFREQARTWTIVFFALAILTSLAVGVLLLRSVLVPITALRRAAQRIGAGDLGTRVEVKGRNEFSELASTFNQMAADLTRHQEEIVRSQKLAFIGQMAAGVAHEINNPLSVILGHAALLRRDPDLGTSEELQIIEDETRQCQRIVRDLLELARPAELRLAPVSLVDLARQTVERLAEAAAVGEVAVRFPDEGAAPATVEGDERRLRQVLQNVILNAVQASKAAAGEREGPPEVVIEADASADEVVLRVLDAGPGIAPEALARIFEPFYTTKEGGTGLGLTNAQTIMESHGGRIEIAPRGGPGAGTAVTLRFPNPAPGA